MARSEIFRRHVAADPANPLFRFSLGQALFTEGDPAGAVEHLRLAAASKADWMMPRILLGKSLLAVGDRAYEIFRLDALQADFEALGRSRATVMQALRTRGVGTQVHYLPVFWHPYYRRHADRWLATAMAGATRLNTSQSPVVTNTYRRRPGRCR